MEQQYRYSKAVDAHSKGDTFTADENNPYVLALLGAGYADPVLEPIPEEEDDDGPGPVRGTPIEYPFRTSTARSATGADSVPGYRASKPKVGPV